jgi:hypothetical protein
MVKRLRRIKKELSFKNDIEKVLGLGDMFNNQGSISLSFLYARRFQKRKKTVMSSVYFSLLESSIAKLLVKSWRNRPLEG